MFEENDVRKKNLVPKYMVEKIKFKKKYVRKKKMVFERKRPCAGRFVIVSNSIINYGRNSSYSDRTLNKQKKN